MARYKTMWQEDIELWLQGENGDYWVDIGLSMPKPEHQGLNECLLCSKNMGCPNFSYTRPYCADKYNTKTTNQITTKGGLIKKGDNNANTSKS